MARRRALLAFLRPALPGDVVRVVPAESAEPEHAHESDRENAAETRLDRSRAVYERAAALAEHLVRNGAGRPHRTAPATPRSTPEVPVPESSRRPLPPNP